MSKKVFLLTIFSILAVAWLATFVMIEKQAKASPFIPDIGLFALGNIDDVVFTAHSASVSKDNGAGHVEYDITIKGAWVDAAGDPSSGDWYVTVTYIDGQPITIPRDKFGTKFQQLINEYNDSQTLLNGAGMTTILNYLTNNLP